MNDKQIANLIKTGALIAFRDEKGKLQCAEVGFDYSEDLRMQIDNNRLTIEDAIAELRILVMTNHRYHPN